MAMAWSHLLMASQYLPSSANCPPSCFNLITDGGVKTYHSSEFVLYTFLDFLSTAK